MLVLYQLSFLLVRKDAYLVEHCGAISSFSEGLNTDALETLFILSIFFPLPWTFAVFSRAAICLDVREVRISGSFVPAFAERWHNFDTHLDLGFRDVWVLLGTEENEEIEKVREWSVILEHLKGIFMAEQVLRRLADVNHHVRESGY